MSFVTERTCWIIIHIVLVVSTLTGYYCVLIDSNCMWTATICSMKKHRWYHSCMTANDSQLYITYILFLSYTGGFVDWTRFASLMSKWHTDWWWFFSFDVSLQLLLVLHCNFLCLSTSNYQICGDLESGACWNSMLDFKCKTVLLTGS